MLLVAARVPLVDVVVVVSQRPSSSRTANANTPRGQEIRELGIFIACCSIELVQFIFTLILVVVLLLLLLFLLLLLLQKSIVTSSSFIWENCDSSEPWDKGTSSLESEIVRTTIIVVVRFASSSSSSSSSCISVLFRAGKFIILARVVSSISFIGSL